ncbi:hypothetical protein [Ammoniphilus sp. CFH 90114]|uniref:hypothetical protein n=1 Tax=Ammoniphilus sp. CFH 90114 TaxID=2493665 RepID=UPI00100DE790|nr:hypothetical protein [Ammoniphilus sp. CFH 90114]RXT13714.1 hypothetical protein EIZ39_06090 [Ammoniphilus sp. CFH 90114]
MRVYFILMMCGVFLVNYFLRIEWLEYLVVAMVFAAFASSSLIAKGFPRLLGLGMMATGVFLEFYKGSGIEGVSQGLLLVLPLLCLIVLAPLIALPLRVGGYFAAIDSLLRNLLHHPKKFFAGITGTMFILSPVLNLGSVRIINEFLKDLKLPSTVSAKSYLVGFSSSPMWSPYFASVSLVLYYLHIPVGDYIVYGFCFSLLSLLIGNVLFVVWERGHPLITESSADAPLERKHRNQLVQLVFFVFTLMSVSLLIESITHWSMLVIVSLISIIFPFLWALLFKGWTRLLPQLKSYRSETVPMMSNEIMLFTSAGLLGHAVQGTDFADGIGHFLNNMAQYSFFMFALTVMIIVIVFTYIGLHQLAVVSALAMQLNAQSLEINNLALAMLLLLAWSTSTVLSPFSGLNLMVSRISGISGFQVGFRSNGLHVSIVAIIGIVFISFLR